MTHDQRHASIGIHGLHAHEAAHNIRRVAIFKRARKVSLGLMGALGLGVALLLVQRTLHSQSLHQTTEDAAQLHVTYVLPQSGNAAQSLELPGTLIGYTETSLYARTSGFVSKWYKDMGDHVKAGELLATLSTPELDQQLAEARATFELARVSYERWRAMRQKDAVSQQEFDERSNAFKVAETNVLRLEALVRFNRIEAPFAGVVTKRNIDVGSLVDAGNGGAPKLLFTVSQTDPMRLYVGVPQAYAPGIQVGNTAQVRLAEMPGRVFAGKVVRTAQAIDASSRTMQVEVNLPNNKGELLPGAYVTTTFQTKGPAQTVLTIPNNALLFRTNGVAVATVADGKIAIKQLQLGKDFGTQVQVIDGLTANDQVVINPPDSINDGQSVSATLYSPPAKPSAPAASAAKPGASA